MRTLAALLLIVSTALLGACNKTAGDKSGGTAGSPNGAASTSK
jgi:predicted small secreted protein